MDSKEVLFTNESEVTNWENGEVFQAFYNESHRNKIRFTVSSEYVVERNDGYVMIDTANDADF